VLVAGGIGITPALAILRAVLCRYQAIAAKKHRRAYNYNRSTTPDDDHQLEDGWSGLC
jgi:predicted ferric reductase